MKFDWNNRFRKLYYNPTTALGNPLYKIQDLTKQKSFVKNIMDDSEYQQNITQFYTSPSNVRGIIVGINSSIVVYHQCPIGSNEMMHIQRMKTLDDIFWDNPDEITYGDGLYQIDGHHFSYSKKEIINMESAPIIKISKNPIDVIMKEHPFINLEFIIVSWNAFSPSAWYDDESIKQSLEQYGDISKRFQRAYFIKDDITSLMPELAKACEQYSLQPFVDFENFIDLSSYIVVSKQDSMQERLQQNYSNYSYDNELENYNREHNLF